MVERILGSMSTPDGLWRVQAIRDRGRHWFRLWHQDRILQDHLVIGSLEFFLDQYGVSFADFTEDD